MQIAQELPVFLQGYQTEGVPVRALLFLMILAARCGAANLVSNSSFEFGTNGWTQFPGPITLTNGGTHGAVACVLPRDSGMQSGPIQLTAGSYSCSFDVRSPAGDQGPFFAAVLPSPDPDKNAWGFSVGNTTADWQRKVFTFVAPSNGAYYFKVASAQPDCWIDAVQLEAGPATPYAPQATATQSLLCVWDANKEPFCAGYRICAGPGSRRYTVTNTVVGRFNTNGSVPMLPGVNYVAVLAYANDGTVSGFSAEAIWINRPATPTRFRISGQTTTTQEVVP